MGNWEDVAPPIPELAGPSGKGPGRHGRLCGNCHVEFPRAEALRLRWCDTEKCYVCPRCEELVCTPKKHRTGGRVSGSLLLIAMIGMWTLPFMLPGIYDLAIETHWNDLPDSSIGSAADGDEVKLMGTINSTTDIALGYSETYDSDAGYDWVWDTADTFDIEDGTGRVRVVVDKYYDIKESGDWQRLTPHTDGPAYLNGTEVTAIGTIRLEGGQKVLHLKYLQPGGGDIPLDFLSMFLISFIIFIFIVAAILVGERPWRHRRLHNEKVGDARPAEPPPDRARRDPEARWSRNIVPRPRRVDLIGTAVMMSEMLVIYPLFVLLDGHKGDLYIFVLVAVFSSFILVLMPLLVMFQPVPAPSEVGISPKGIHFWYASPSKRMLWPNLLPWEKIEKIEETGEGWRRSWRLVRNDNEHFYPSGLSAETKAMLLWAWSERSKVKRPS